MAQALYGAGDGDPQSGGELPAGREGRPLPRPPRELVSSAPRSPARQEPGLGYARRRGGCTRCSPACSQPTDRERSPREKPEGSLPHRGQQKTPKGSWREGRWGRAALEVGTQGRATGAPGAGGSSGRPKPAQAGKHRRPRGVGSGSGRPLSRAPTGGRVRAGPGRGKGSALRAGGAPGPPRAPTCGRARAPRPAT